MQTKKQTQRQKFCVVQEGFGSGVWVVIKKIITIMYHLLLFFLSNLVIITAHVWCLFSSYLPIMQTSEELL